MTWWAVVHNRRWFFGLFECEHDALNFKTMKAPEVTTGELTIHSVDAATAARIVVNPDQPAFLARKP